MFCYLVFKARRHKFVRLIKDRAVSMSHMHVSDEELVLSNDKCTAFCFEREVVSVEKKHKLLRNEIL